MRSSKAALTVNSLLAPINRRYGTYRGLARLLLAFGERYSGRLAPFLSPDLSTTRRLVFVCSGNICRSCFADYLARSMGIPSASFGLRTTTGSEAFPDAIQAAHRAGIDLRPHRVTEIDDFVIREGDLLLAMEIRHARQLLRLTRFRKCQVSLLGLWAQPPRPHIHDPHTLSGPYFDTCFKVVASALKQLGEELRRTQNSASRERA